MRKLALISIMLLLAVSGAFAQWQPSDDSYTRLDKEGVSEQMLLKTLRTADGKTILTWLRWSEGLTWADPQAGFYLHLQVFDAAGKALFGDEGIIVSNKPTATYATDYGLALAPNGDILMAYPDARNNVEKVRNDVYAYRYTQQGESVWSADGVKVSVEGTAESSVVAPSLCVSGENVYLSMRRGDETSHDIQLTRLNGDGSRAWDSNLTLATDMLTMCQAPEGDVYIIYSNATYGLEAQRLNKDKQNVWAAAVTVEEEPLSGDGSYVEEPLCAVDEEGGVMLAYRKLLTLTGYQVFNRLAPDGSVLPQAVLGTGSTDGDSGGSVMAVKGQQSLIAWKQTTEDHQMQVYMNLFNADGSYAWSDHPLGIVLDAGSEWDYRPVKLIPQSDGWLLLYGDATDWNAAKFLACKINDQGEEVWRKQLGEGDFRSSGFSVVYDDNYAYIFFTRDDDVSETGETIPGSGGMFVMCVDITKGASGIHQVRTSRAAQGKVYDLQGRQVNSQFSILNSQFPKGVVIVNGRKVVMK